MSMLTWNPTGERIYETGVEKGVLYPLVDGAYSTGVAWNGLSAVTESPSGAEATAIYADNIKYLNLISTEEFACTIEAYTYPDEFAKCDGSIEIAPGVFAGQQNRQTFGLAYKTLIGDDEDGTDRGYKIHLVYGAKAAPSEKGYATENDSPEAITFSWEVSTTPVTVTTKTDDGATIKPLAIITIDSTKTATGKMAALEALLYGTADTEPSLPLPDAIITLMTDED